MFNRNFLDHLLGDPPCLGLAFFRPKNDDGMNIGEVDDQDDQWERQKML